MKSAGYFLMAVVVSAVFGAAGAPAQEVDCLKCHSKLKAQPVVHAAVEMGCVGCHTGIDASRVPHRKTSQIAKGLSSDQPDLCYGCHDKAAFGKKHVHAAVGMGCTGCHDPHAAKHAKLLNAEPPELCYSCHDRKAFEGKVVHAPVAGGMCLSCHGPHATDAMSLLLAEPEETCLNCHPEVLKRTHAVAGITGGGHPVQTVRKFMMKTDEGKKEMTIRRKDPARPDKPFYCGSCHEPHSAQVKRLLRFNAKTTMQLCANCHKF